MTFLQGSWLVCVDVFLLIMAWAGWSEFQHTRDPVDSRYAFAFAGFACVSIPLFFV